MTDRQAQQANKWLDRRQDTANQWQSANSHFSVRDIGVTGSMMSDGSPSLMFSVGGEKRLTSKQMRDILNMPDDGLDRSLISNAIWGLLEQAKQLRTKTKDDGLQEFQSTNRSMAFQSEIGQVKFKRSALVQEQEGLRAEILQLNERLERLEEIKTSLTNKNSKKSPKKQGVPAINQKSMSIDHITQELLELGVVKKLSTSDKVGQNDEAVSQHHTELITIQRKSIDEMSKYELLQLKKPKYTLLMDRVSRIKEPNEPHELKLLKKVIKNINLLYGRINEIDIEMTNHRIEYGHKVKDLDFENQSLGQRIRELRNEINRTNVQQAFKESDLKHMKATEFLEANPVPYNFAQIIRDYKLLDVFGDCQK